MARRAWAWVIFGVLMSAVAAQHFQLAVRRFVAADDRPNHIVKDAYRRWIETQYVLGGQNPFDVAFAAFGPPYAPGVGRNAAVRPELGVPDVGYPPWAYVSALPFFAVPERAYKPWYVLWMAAGIAATAGWAASVAPLDNRGDGRVGDRAAAFALAAAVLAMVSWGDAVVLGNYPPVVVAALVGVLVAVARGRPVLAGLAMGFALVKPTIAVPFWVALLVRRQWLAAGVAVAVVAAECGLTWALTHTSPVEMFAQSTLASLRFVRDGYGPVEWLISAGLPAPAAIRTAAVVGTMIGVPAMWVARTSWLRLFAVAAVYARLWAYHHVYDDAALVFLLAAAFVDARRAGGSERGPAAWGLFFVIGAALWVPRRYIDLPWVQASQLAVYVIAGARVAAGGPWAANGEGRQPIAIDPSPADV